MAEALYCWVEVYTGEADWAACCFSASVAYDLRLASAGGAESRHESGKVSAYVFFWEACSCHRAELRVDASEGSGEADLWS